MSEDQGVLAALSAVIASGLVEPKDREMGLVAEAVDQALDEAIARRAVNIARAIVREVKQEK